MSSSFEDVVWDSNEILPREELRKLQLERLRKSLKQAKKIPLYKERFADVNPEDIKDISDIKKFPITTKEDLRSQYPLNMLAVDRSEISRVHGSSGTNRKTYICCLHRK